MLADRKGRLEDRPLRLKVQIFPYDYVDMNALLVSLQESGFIARYTVKGDRYIAIPKFLHHQSPHCREPESALPAPPRGLIPASGLSDAQHLSSTVLASGRHQSGPSVIDPESVAVAVAESESLSGDGKKQDRGYQQQSSAVDRLLADVKKKGVSRRFRGRL